MPFPPISLMKRCYFCLFVSLLPYFARISFTSILPSLPFCFVRSLARSHNQTPAPNNFTSALTYHQPHPHLSSKIFTSPTRMTTTMTTTTARALMITAVATKKETYGVGVGVGHEILRELTRIRRPRRRRRRLVRGLGLGRLGMTSEERRGEEEVGKIVGSRTCRVLSR